MRKKFKNLLYFISFLIISFLVLGFFYYIYITFINKSTDLKVFENMSVNYMNGAKLKIKNDKDVKVIVTNTSDDDAYYYIEFKNIKNVDDVDYIVTNGKDIKISDKLNSFNTIVSSYILLKSGATEEYKICFKSNQAEKYSLELNFAKEGLDTNTFAEIILKNNEIKKNSITKIGEETAVEDEGLIETTDDYGTSYYFRGNVKNNYVLIKDSIFRIVRINGDGSVKLILDQATEDLKKYSDGAEDYSYENSIVNTYMKNWVNTHLKGYTVYLANYKYCNDILFENNTFYASTRIKEDNIPSLVCLSKKVLSKVGLLTVDEVIYAGATIHEDNQKYYLYNSSIEQDSFLMTSSFKNEASYYPFSLSKNGKVIDDTPSNFLRSVRPVITIIKTAIVEGKGTKDNPYILTQ